MTHKTVKINFINSGDHGYFSCVGWRHDFKKTCPPWQRKRNLM